MSRSAWWATTRPRSSTSRRYAADKPRSARVVNRSGASPRREIAGIRRMVDAIDDRGSAAPALTPAELSFLTAAVDTLIPADALSPSGSDCGVVDFMARDLAGPWGNGVRLYRDGPYFAGKPEHGYQLGLTPHELIRQGIAAANAWTHV